MKLKQTVRIKLYRVISDFKKGYQPRTNIVKDEKGDLVADSHNILDKWRNYFSELLNVHKDIDVRQAEIHAAEPLVPEASAFEIELPTEKLRRYKLPGTVEISAELFKARGSKICCEIRKLVNSVWNKDKLPEQWKESVIVSVYKKGDKTNYHGLSLMSATCKVLSNIFLSRLTPYTKKLLGIISICFHVTGQLLIIYLAFVKFVRKKCE
jgi:hypothetical protein